MLVADLSADAVDWVSFIRTIDLHRAYSRTPEIPVTTYHLISSSVTSAADTRREARPR